MIRDADNVIWTDGLCYSALRSSPILVYKPLLTVLGVANCTSMKAREIESHP